MNINTLEALANVSKQIGGGVMPANPETILALIALLREMREFLDTLDFADDDTEQQQLLAKYKEMTNGS